MTEDRKMKGWKENSI